MASVPETALSAAQVNHSVLEPMQQSASIKAMRLEDGRSLRDRLSFEELLKEMPPESKAGMGLSQRYTSGRCESLPASLMDDTEVEASNPGTQAVSCVDGVEGDTDGSSRAEEVHDGRIEEVGEDEDDGDDDEGDEGIGESEEFED